MVQDLLLHLPTSSWMRDQCFGMDRWECLKTHGLLREQKPLLKQLPTQKPSPLLVGEILLLRLLNSNLMTKLTMCQLVAEHHLNF